MSDTEKGYLVFNEYDSQIAVRQLRDEGFRAWNAPNAKSAEWWVITNASQRTVDKIFFNLKLDIVKGTEVESGSSKEGRLSYEDETAREDIANAIQMLELDLDEFPGPRDIRDDVLSRLKKALRKMR